MTEAARDEAVSDSGGTMRRLTEPASDLVPDLGLLEPLRRSAYDVPVQPVGEPPYFTEGVLPTWHYGLSVDVLRVVHPPGTVPRRGVENRRARTTSGRSHPDHT